jgi:hypothetical protein
MLLKKSITVNTFLLVLRKVILVDDILIIYKNVAIWYHLVNVISYALTQTDNIKHSSWLTVKSPVSGTYDTVFDSTLMSENRNRK